MRPSSQNHPIELEVRISSICWLLYHLISFAQVLRMISSNDIDGWDTKLSLIKAHQRTCSSSSTQPAAWTILWKETLTAAFSSLFQSINQSINFAYLINTHQYTCVITKNGQTPIKWNCVTRAVRSFSSAILW